VPRISVKDFGMPSKRKSVWGDKAHKLFKLKKSGATMEEIYEAFPEKTKDKIIDKLHKMGFSAVDK
jgi:hypothetical protein